ncbi:MAG TPA: hypothetical protein VHE55_11685 [Fimbriimonadaceae bacterium]|nr:hypothetical protein [Fimbriimonadaceae bacterium]
MEIGAAQTLSQAIELILTIDAQSAVAAAKARERANELGDIFEQWMQAKIDGQVGSSPAPYEPFKPDLQSMQDQVSSTLAREGAFLDAFGALMELNANPANQVDCRFIFDRLRLARQAGWETQLEAPAIDPGKFAADPSQDPAERKLELLKSFQGFQQQMRARVERHRDELGKAAEKCRAYLEEALAAAQRMANAAN